MKKIIEKKLSVTVTIPALNEEGNIASIINSISQQKQGTFNLDKIVVYSDGSTDQTVTIVKRLQKKIINLSIVENLNRSGKAKVLNQIFKESKQSDILVVLDADIGLVGEEFLENLIGVFEKDPKALMVAAHQIPLKTSSLVGKLIHGTYATWDFIRWSVPNYQSVHNFYGAATAYKTSFSEKIGIPPEVPDERLYIYLCAKNRNGFRYSKEAQILYWPINTFQDYLRISKRGFGTRQPLLNDIFGFDTTLENIIPFKFKLIGLLKSFYHQPFYTPLALAMFFMSKLYFSGKKHSHDPMFEIVKSTKKTINYAN
jgi:glycosyltransferase involved in cell wall biosynthesis